MARRQDLHGCNWARITFLALFLVGAVPYALNLLAMFDRSVLTGAVSATQFALQLCALYLLFTSPGAGWFRRRRAGTVGIGS